MQQTEKSKWCAALPSPALKKGARESVRLFRKELVIYRSQSGVVHAVQAFCPHMGAHLKEGIVEGELLRCGFHDWKFDAAGRCVASPALARGADPACAPRLQTYPVKEESGTIWVREDVALDLAPEGRAPEVSPAVSFNDPGVLPHGWYFIASLGELAKKTGRNEAVEIAVDRLELRVERALGEGFRVWLNRAELPAEKIRADFGLLWFYFGDSPWPDGEIAPRATELGGERPILRVGPVKTRGCHFSVIIGTALDADHFPAVHRKFTRAFGLIHWEARPSGSRILTYVHRSEPATRGMIERVFRQPGQFDMTVCGPANVLIEMGPARLRFYQLKCYRPGRDGSTDFINVHLAPRPRNWFARLKAWVNVCLSEYFDDMGSAEDAPFHDTFRFALDSASDPQNTMHAYVDFYNRLPASRLDGRPGISGP